MTTKQYVSDAIDFLICLLPLALLLYQVRIQEEFPKLNGLILLSAIYIVYGLLSMLLNAGRTIGNLFLGITLIRTTTGAKSRVYFLLRMFLFSLTMAAASNMNLVFVSLLIVWVLPIKFVVNGYDCISPISFLTKTTYMIERKIGPTENELGKA